MGFSLFGPILGVVDAGPLLAALMVIPVGLVWFPVMERQNIGNFSQWIQAVVDLPRQQLNMKFFTLLDLNTNINGQIAMII